MLQVGPQEQRQSPRCLWLLWQSTHCVAQLLQCSTRWFGHLVGVLSALRKQCNHSVHHQAWATSQELSHRFSKFNRADRVPGLLGCPWGQGWLLSLLYLWWESGSQHRLSCFLAWVFCPVQTDGVGDWETRGPMQNRKPSLVAWTHSKRFRVTS